MSELHRRFEIPTRSCDDPGVWELDLEYDPETNRYSGLTVVRQENDLDRKCVSMEVTAEWKGEGMHSWTLTEYRSEPTRLAITVADMRGEDGLDRAARAMTMYLITRGWCPADR